MVGGGTARRAGPGRLERGRGGGSVGRCAGEGWRGGQAVAGFDRGGDGRDGDATARAVLGQRVGAVPHRAVGTVAGGARAAGLGHVRGGGGDVAGDRAGGRCRRGAARTPGPGHGDGGGDVDRLPRPVVPLVGGGGRPGGGGAGAGEPGDQPAGRRGRAGGAPRYGGGDQTVRGGGRRVGWRAFPAGPRGRGRLAGGVRVGDAARGRPVAGGVVVGAARPLRGWDPVAVGTAAGLGDRIDGLLAADGRVDRDCDLLPAAVRGGAAGAGRMGGRRRTLPVRVGRHRGPDVVGPVDRSVAARAAGTGLAGRRRRGLSDVPPARGGRFSRAGVAGRAGRRRHRGGGERDRDGSGAA